jgi:hypothetical protein
MISCPSSPVWELQGVYLVEDLGFLFQMDPKMAEVLLLL